MSAALRRALGSLSRSAVALLLLLIAAAVLIEPALLSERAIRNVLVTASPLMLLAAAQALVLLTGGVDLSVGPIVSISNVMAAALMLASPELSAPIIACALLAGGLVGALNGWLVAFARLNPFILTLSTGMAVQGLALAIMDQPSGRVTAGFRQMARATVGPVPIAVLAIAALFVILVLMLRHTRYGISLFAIGGNEASARVSGLRVRPVKLSVYAVSGVLSAVGGLLLAARVGSGDPLIGEPYSLDSITAAVLGGASLAGGVVNLAGAFAASILLAIINSVLNLQGVSPFIQWIVKGLILIAALALDRVRRPGVAA